jgi:hypothetical protein
MNRSNKFEIEMYKTRLISTFSTLKQIDSYEAWNQKHIYIGNNMGILGCICELHANDDNLIAKLANWREEATTFRDQFEVTFESTKKWLRELLLNVPDRILFLVMDNKERPVGNMGFARSLNDDGFLEFDNLIRGVHGVSPEIMTEGARTLFTWATENIQPQAIISKPFKHNTYSINFHKYIGFDLVSGCIKDKDISEENDEYQVTMIYRPQK